MIEAIKVVLKGIDQTELESPDGWWETSAGAEFGAKKLKYILGLLAQPPQPEERNFCSRCGKRTADLTVIHTCTPPQPEQEPVAWATRMGEYAHIHWGAKRPEYPMVYEAPLYTTPPQRKPLTRGQIREIEVDVALNPSFDYITPAEQLCRAIEAAHGIKE